MNWGGSRRGAKGGGAKEGEFLAKAQRAEARRGGRELCYGRAHKRGALAGVLWGGYAGREPCFGG